MRKERRGSEEEDIANRFRNRWEYPQQEGGGGRDGGRGGKEQGKGEGREEDVWGSKEGEEESRRWVGKGGQKRNSAARCVDIRVETGRGADE